MGADGAQAESDVLAKLFKCGESSLNLHSSGTNYATPPISAVLQISGTIHVARCLRCGAYSYSIGGGDVSAARAVKHQVGCANGLALEAVLAELEAGPGGAAGGV